MRMASEPMSPVKQAILVILDGWGEAKPSASNAIAHANTPQWDALSSQANRTSLAASGTDVGLPGTQMGNSEVGHMHIGAGRILRQDLTRIKKTIEDGDFDVNPTIIEAISEANDKGSNLHVLGLLSPGGVHSHEDHIFRLIELLKVQLKTKGFVHAFLDGRDTPPQSAKASIERLHTLCEEGPVTATSIMGRFFAMDRDNRWERIKIAYELLSEGKSDYHSQDINRALGAAYGREETDEFVTPSLAARFDGIKDNDVVIFMNFRADRARELAHVLTEPAFHEFERPHFAKISLYTLTRYAQDLDATFIFAPQMVENSLGEVISKQGLKQLRIAETEKYAHVTFFLNGGQELPFEGEERVLIPSPKVTTYDLKPEMSAAEVTDAACEKLRDDTYTLTVINFANADMVGHTGNFDATVKAIETLDTCIGRLAEAANKLGAELIITSDHGNAEKMFSAANEQPHTAHTSNLVPCLHIGRKAVSIRKSGSLVNIAPTVLAILGIEIPPEMTALPLFEFES